MRIKTALHKQDFAIPFDEHRCRDFGMAEKAILGDGVITGGDDGRLIWHRRADAGVLATSARGQWIDAVDASAETLAAAVGLVAGGFNFEEAAGALFGQQGLRRFKTRSLTDQEEREGRRP